MSIILYLWVLYHMSLQDGCLNHPGDQTMDVKDTHLNIDFGRPPLSRRGRLEVAGACMDTCLKLCPKFLLIKVIP